MKIVMGIDESPQARAALNWVRQMRWPLGTRFVLVSAVPLEVMTYALGAPGGAFVVPEVDDGHMKERHDLVERAEQELQSVHLATVSLVERGDPRDVILDAAAREQADLVIVGSHGRSGVPKLLMGSVASHVVTHASCAVLVIKQPRETKSGNSSVRT